MLLLNDKNVFTPVKTDIHIFTKSKKHDIINKILFMMIIIYDDKCVV